MTLRTHDLEEVGSLDAPPGSREWAIAVRHELQGRLSDERASAAALKGMLSLMAEHEGWKELSGPAGKPFRTFEQFCLARHPFGLGYDLAAINRIVADREVRDARQVALEAQPVGAHGGDRKSAEASAHQPYNDKVDSDSAGAGAGYLAARLKRDRPDILDRVISGELPSMRAAAKEAGIPLTETCTHALTPAAFARAALKHLGVNGCRALMAELEARLGAR